MKRFAVILALIILGSTFSFGSPLSTNTRTVIPSDVQQIITVDYRALRNSPVALQLKNRVLPDNLKEFETALKGIGIDPDTDVEQLAFASFRVKTGLRVVGVATVSNEVPSRQDESQEDWRD